MSANGTGARGVGSVARDAIQVLAGLGSNTARMAGLEARCVARRAVSRVAILLAATALAGSAALLLLGAVSLAAAEALDLPLWASFALVGGAALAVAVAVGWIALRQLRAVDLTFPETRAEIRRDIDAFPRLGRDP